MGGGTVRVAAVQAASVYLDADASTDKACTLIRVAAERGAELVAFGEAWISGYPIFAITEPPALRSRRSVARFAAGAIDVPGPHTDALCRAACDAGVDVVIGVAERDPETSATLYCTLLFIGADGRLLGRHRKLKPTAAERMVWGEGDGSSLVVYQRRYGRISGLNCWEHQMMLPGYALAAQGTQIHVAAWPSGAVPGSQQEVLASSYASQAACVVVSIGGVRPVEEFPEEARGGMIAFDGVSQIIGPFGQVLATSEPGESTVVADIALDDLAVAKALCDIGGHYSRPDIFQLHINRLPARRVAPADLVGSGPRAGTTGSGGIGLGDADGRGDGQ